MESQVSSMRRPCFRVEDDGLASIAGFSGNNTQNHAYSLNPPHHQNQGYNNNNNHNMCYNGIGGGGNIMMRRRNSLRNINSLSSVSTTASTSSVFSPRSGRVLEGSRSFDEIHSPHFLESCALCKKPLGGNRDIFMYRGDTPFCSEECRQEQINIDESKEKKRNFKVLRSKKETAKSSTSSSVATNSSSSPSKTQNYPYRTGTVAAA